MSDREDGNVWFRERLHRQTDPDERNTTRESLMLRLFGTTDPEPTDDQPNNGPDAA